MGEMKKVVNLSKKELEEANDLINQVEGYDQIGRASCRERV